MENSQKTLNKKALGSSYLSIFTLNINGLYFPIKIEWVDGFKKDHF